MVIRKVIQTRKTVVEVGFNRCHPDFQDAERSLSHGERCTEGLLYQAMVSVSMDGNS